MTEPTKKNNKLLIGLIGCGVLIVGGLFCSGIMAAIGIPAFNKYLKQTKSSEAALNLREIADLVSSHKVAKGKLPPATEVTPATSCCDSGGKCPLVAKEWNVPGWKDIGYTPWKPGYYRYQLTKDGESMIISAFGDLDCDGIESHFKIKVSADGQTTPVYQDDPSTELE